MVADAGVVSLTGHDHDSAIQASPTQLLAHQTEPPVGEVLWFESLTFGPSIACVEPHHRRHADTVAPCVLTRAGSQTSFAAA